MNEPFITTKEAVRELYFWQYSERPTNFHALLYDLIAKADDSNLTRLSRAYPDEVAAWRLWYFSADPVKFFKEAGVWP